MSLGTRLAVRTGELIVSTVLLIALMEGVSGFYIWRQLKREGRL